MYKKKSLGQHFLRAKTYLRSMVDAASLRPGELVVEIGPGEGTLTRELLDDSIHPRVLVIEKDSRLIPILADTFANDVADGRLRIVEGDALEFDISKHLSNSEPYTVVGNIPYYITGALLRKYLEASAQPHTLVFLIQKEVAQRIAKSKKESLLSLSIKAYGVPTLVRSVPRGAFAPAPNVDSAILRVTDISRKNFIDRAHEERFFALIHAGFAQKRKLLRRNLEAVLGEKAGEHMERASIAANARAEDVALVAWLELAKNSIAG